MHLDGKCHILKFRKLQSSYDSVNSATFQYSHVYIKLFSSEVKQMSSLQSGPGNIVQTFRILALLVWKAPKVHPFQIRFL